MNRILALICRVRGHNWTDDQDMDVAGYPMLIGTICSRCRLTVRRPAPLDEPEESE